MIVYMFSLLVPAYAVVPFPFYITYTGSPLGTLLNSNEWMNI